MRFAGCRRCGHEHAQHRATLGEGVTVGTDRPVAELERRADQAVDPRLRAEGLAAGQRHVRARGGTDRRIRPRRHPRLREADRARHVPHRSGQGAGGAAAGDRLRGAVCHADDRRHRFRSPSGQEVFPRFDVLHACGSAGGEARGRYPAVSGDGQASGIRRALLRRHLSADEGADRAPTEP